MAKRSIFSKPGIWVEAVRDFNGLSYNAWRPGISKWCSTRKELLKWLAWPPKTPTGDELRAWLDEMEASQRPVVTAVTEQAGLDPLDPNYQTKTVI